MLGVKPSVSAPVLLVIATVIVWISSHFALGVRLDVLPLVLLALATLSFIAKVRLTDALSTEGFVYYKACVDGCVTITFAVAILFMLQLASSEGTLFYPLLLDKLGGDPAHSKDTGAMAGGVTLALLILVSMVTYSSAKRTRALIAPESQVQPSFLRKAFHLTAYLTSFMIYSLLAITKG